MLYQKLRYLFLILLALLLAAVPVSASNHPPLKDIDEVRYEIDSYQGDLTIHEDNTADFVQTISYRFETEFNGQYVSLGEAGKVPAGFAIVGKPEVTATINGEQTISALPAEDSSYDYYIGYENLGDGKRLMIYNAGNSGDYVTITVRWKLENILTIYEDIAELNWVPISDWDSDLNKVSLTVKTDTSVSQKELYAHTGYFGEAAEVSGNQPYHIRLAKVREGKKLELHAYWDKSAISQASVSAPGKGLSDFQQTEANIANNTKLVRLAVFTVGPALLLISAGFLALWYWRLHRSLMHLPNKDSRAHLYEPPQDLSPMVLASAIYSVDMKEIKPTQKQNHTFSFKDVIQASILDLIDRGNLEAQELTPLTLTIKHREGLSAAEQQLLTMMFEQESSLTSEQLFSRYAIDKGIFKAKKAKQKQIRKQGQSVESKIGSDFKTLTQLVNKDKHALKLPNYYRKLDKQHQKTYVWILFLLSLILLAAVGLFAMAIYFGGFAWPLLLPFLLALGLLLFIGKDYNDKKRDGMLTAEGLEVYYLWQSFRNMLRDIRDFGKDEIEAVVLWNRLLVYATLFGYADRVRKVIRLHKIELSNPSLNSYIYHNVFFNYTMTQNLSTYASTAKTASNFSVSSGGGGGGFSGGGFSGGGGGGGGGAF